MNQAASPSKAIAPARDRFQSRALVAVLLVLLGAASLQWIATLGFVSLVIVMLGVSWTFAVLVWVLRAATPAGAFAGGLVCFLLGVGTGRPHASALHSGLVPLAALFILTFASTRVARSRKASPGIPTESPAERRRGRSAAQVLANLGAAGLVASGFVSILIDRQGPASQQSVQHVGASLWAGPLLALAALVEATADTVSSELGQAFGGTPILLTTLRRVPPGTDGAISPLGTLAGIAAGALVALVGKFALSLSPKHTAIALTAGTAGLLFDSLLGATVERRGFLGNDLVNFTSTLFAAAVAECLFILL